MIITHYSLKMTPLVFCCEDSIIVNDIIHYSLPMSTFAVELRNIAEIIPHTNADRLALAKVEGLDYQFVILKEVYQVGEPVIYFPIDSLLPAPLIEKLGLVGRLSGPQKNRVKTVRLRGEISQGLVCKVSDIQEWLPAGAELLQLNLTEVLGVTKYEPEPITCLDGKLIPLPHGVSAYDIEGCDRFMEVVKDILEVPVWISEKLEGTHFSVTVQKDGHIFVNQRNYSIIEVEGKEHDFWRVARKQGLIDLAKNMLRSLNVTQLTLRGELLGPKIQNNLYRLKDHQVFIFDILMNMNYVEVTRLFSLAEQFGFTNRLVPTIAYNVILQDWLNGQTLKNASNGDSLIAKTIREGIVIKPMQEMTSTVLGGRLVLKQRSPVYLAKTDF